MDERRNGYAFSFFHCFYNLSGGKIWMSWSWRLKSKLQLQKQIAHELLINSGWSEDDIQKCRNEEPENVVMILLA